MQGNIIKTNNCISITSAGGLLVVTGIIHLVDNALTLILILIYL